MKAFILVVLVDSYIAIEKEKKAHDVAFEAAKASAKGVSGLGPQISLEHSKCLVDRTKIAIAIANMIAASRAEYLASIPKPVSQTIPSPVMPVATHVAIDETEAFNSAVVAGEK